MKQEDLISEQIEYYRARASEYDEWFVRQGRYDRGPEANGRWFAEVERLRAALRDFAPRGHVLELAGGTGNWTRELVMYADTLTVVDASAEVLDINRGRIGSASVNYVVADLLNWRPDRQYDCVFFSFWLSHVPSDRFEAFWSMVSSCLAPGGRVFFLDSLYEGTSTAVDHHLEGEDASTVTRRLNDGREFRIVKVFYDSEELAGRLRGLGFDAVVERTSTYFLYGWLAPVESPINT